MGVIRSIYEVYQKGTYVTHSTSNIQRFLLSPYFRKFIEGKKDSTSGNT